MKTKTGSLKTLGFSEVCCTDRTENEIQSQFEKGNCVNAY